MSFLSQEEGAKIAKAIEEKITNVAKQIVNKMPADKTEYGIIQARDGGFYTVKIKKAIYTKVLSMRNIGELSVGTVVHCLIPNGQYSNMVIIGVADGTIQSGGEVKLYGTTGQHTDGAMTQKATTDELATKLNTSDATTTATANKIVKRDNDGNIFANQIEGTYGVFSESKDSEISNYVGLAVYDTYGFLRKRSLNNLKTDLSIPTLLSQLTNDTGFITKNVNDLTNYTKTSDLATVATSGSYDDLLNQPTIPTVGDGTITITQGGVSKGSFKMNQSGDATIDLDTAKLYNATGQNTDGAMTQKATTDALSTKQATLTTAQLSAVNSGINSTKVGLIDSSLQPGDVVNNVTSTATNKPLSALMGKELQDQITYLKARGRYLSVWNCVTGLAVTTPVSPLPYEYKAGDYFIVGVVSTATPKVNYIPFGSQYTGTASTATTTDEVHINDTFYYDGANWTLLASGGQVNASWGNIGGVLSDQTDLKNALDNIINSIPTKTSDITNDSGFITNAVNNLLNYTLSSALSTVATSGDYGDLLNKPTIPVVPTHKTLNSTNTTSQSTSASESLTGSGTINLHKIAKTGSYSDLLGKPTIPTVGNGTITIKQGNVQKGTFTTNQSGNTTIELDANIGGGAVSKTTLYNGQFSGTGTITLTTPIPNDSLLLSFEYKSNEDNWYTCDTTVPTDMFKSGNAYAGGLTYGNEAKMQIYVKYIDDSHIQVTFSSRAYVTKIVSLGITGNISSVVTSIAGQAGNITASQLISEILTGAVNYGDKITAKQFFTSTTDATMQGYINFASGLKIKYGVFDAGFESRDYWTGITFAGGAFTHTPVIVANATNASGAGIFACIGGETDNRTGFNLGIYSKYRAYGNCRYSYWLAVGD